MRKKTWPSQNWLLFHTHFIWDRFYFSFNGMKSFRWRFSSRSPIWKICLSYNWSFLLFESVGQKNRSDLQSNDPLYDNLNFSLLISNISYIYKGKFFHVNLKSEKNTFRSKMQIFFVAHPKPVEDINVKNLHVQIFRGEIVFHKFFYIKYSKLARIKNIFWTVTRHLQKVQ